MCNIAGYVGNKQAAPILVEMLKKQEGLAGGYYTGIVTYHEGTFYSYKITGDTQYLLDHFDVMNMPGTIGIIHSRSKSGGGDEWAHPFVGRDLEGHIVNYYVANGSTGYFSYMKEEYTRLAQELYDAGYQYDSRVFLDDNHYQTLRDGSKVHMSDVKAQEIARAMGTMSTAAAMEMCYCKVPSELVGLMLMAHTPGAIGYAATNMPMTIARADHGMYLASAALALPEDGRYIQQLPVNASGYVYADRFEMVPFKNPPAELLQMDANVLCQAYNVVENELKTGEKSYKELRVAVKKAIFGDQYAPVTRTVYEVLYAMQREGRISLRNVRVEGAFPHLTAPKIMISFK